MGARAKRNSPKSWKTPLAWIWNYYIYWEKLWNTISEFEVAILIVSQIQNVSFLQDALIDVQYTI